jgi:two-component system, sensor histidine kinase and response regulator
MRSSPSLDWPTNWVRLVAGFTITLAVLVILGWYRSNLTLIQLHPSFAPMHFNSALSFLFCGLGLLSLSFQKTRLTVLFSIPPFMVGALTLLQYLFFINLRIDQLFIKSYITVQTTFPGRMAQTTAFCFICLAISLLANALQSVHKLWLLTQPICSAVIFTVSIIALLGYAAKVPSNIIPGIYFNMAAHTALSFFLISSILLFVGFRNSRLKLESSLYLPALLTGCLLMSSLAVWEAMKAQETEHLTKTLKVNAENLKTVVTFRLKLHFDALTRLAHRWEMKGRPLERDWKYEASLNLKDFDGFNEIRWIDASLQPRWQVKREMTPELTSIYESFLNQRQKDLNDVQNLRQPFRTLTETHRNQALIVSYVPIFVGDRFDGFITSGFIVQDLLDEIIPKEFAHQNSIIILDGDREIYHRSTEAMPSLSAITSIQVSNLDWEIKVFPTPAWMNTNQSKLPHAIFIISLVIALLIPLIIHMGQNARQQTKETENARARFAGIINIAQDAIISIDKNHLITLFNQGAEKVFGYQADEVLGQSLTLLIPDELAQRHAEDIKEFAHSRQSARKMGERNVICGKRKDGSIFPAEATISRLCIGNEIIFTTVLRDITKRKLAEVKLRESEERFRGAMESAAVGIAFVALDGHFLEVNQALCDIVGYTPEELKQKSFQEITYHDDLQPDLNGKQQLLNGEVRTFQIDKRYYHRRGHIIWVQLNAALIYDASEKPLYFISQIQDITSRKHSEEVIRESEEKYRDLFENASDLILSITPDGKFIYVNRAWRNALGYALDEISAMSIWDIVHPDSNEHCSEILRDLFTYESLDKVEMMFLTKDHRTIIVEGNISCKFLDGQPVATRAIFRDITERKRMEKELALSRDEALEATRLKSQFLATMSHEIRTPMNGVLGMVALLLNSELAPGHREQVEIIRTSSNALMTIINDILDFSKIEANKLELSPTDFSLRNLLGDIAKAPAVRAEAKNLDFAYYISPEVPDDLVGDPDRLRQVLNNLVGNAIKFSEAGEVLIRVELLVREEQETILRFSVSDTGVGISKDQHESIFQPFSQADSSMTRLYGGTGLGLAISARLVEMMNGLIWVESEPNKGSTFYFTARFAMQKTLMSQSNLPVAEHLLDLPVLVLEKHPFTRQLILDMLESRGMQASIADTPEMALEILSLAKEAGKPFAIALLDQTLLKNQGSILTNYLQQNPGIVRDVILLGSTVMDLLDSQFIQPLNSSGLVTKPIKPSDLFNCILQVVGAQSQGQKAANDNTNTELTRVSGLRILVAEDNEVNQYLIQNILERHDHKTTIVANGKLALEALEKETFDLVLMDLQMPVMSGFDAVTEIRRNEQSSGKRQYIIALTAHAMKGDRDRCLQAGMDDYVSKPIDVDEFLDKIDQAAATVSRLDSDAKGVCNEAPSAKPELVFANLIAATSGDRKLLQGYIRLFQKKYPLMVQEICQAISAGDSDHLRRAAHTLKGAGGHFFSPGGIEIIKCLERAGRENDLQLAASTFSSFEQELSQLEFNLQNFMTEMAI